MSLPPRHCSYSHPAAPLEGAYARPAQRVARNAWLPLGLLAGIACWCGLGGGHRAAHGESVIPSYIYGIADNNQIYQINPKPGQQSFVSVYNTGLNGQSNAFAFDRVRDQMYFMNPSGSFNSQAYSNGLFLWNKPAGTFSLLASGTAVGVLGGSIPANAAYYQDAFWYFTENSFTLNKVSLSYSGTGSAAVPNGVSGIETFVMNTGGSLAANQNNFGDIAIDIDIGVLYGYTAASGGKFYSLGLSNVVSGTLNDFSLISTTSGTGLQISFNEDYSVLYGHNYTNGRWYDINLTTGSLTDLNFVTTTNGTTGFRDLGGASITAVPEPGSLTLIGAGAGILLAASRRLRRNRLPPAEQMHRHISPNGPMPPRLSPLPPS